MTGPTSESGRMMALTREPSGRRASTRGLVSSMCRPSGREDAVDDVEDVLIVAEGDVDLLDAAGALDVDALGAIDHDLGDGLVGQQRLDGPEARHLLEHAVHEALPLQPGEVQLMLDDEAVHELADDAGQLAAYPGRVGEVDARGEGIDDLRLQAQPDLAEGLLAGREPGGRRRPLAALDGDDEPGRAGALGRARPRRGRRPRWSCRAPAAPRSLSSLPRHVGAATCRSLLKAWA